MGTTFGVWATIAIGALAIYMLHVMVRHSRLSRESRFRESFQDAKFNPSHVYYGKTGYFIGIDDRAMQIAIGTTSKFDIFSYENLVSVERRREKIDQSENEISLHVMTGDLAKPSYRIPFLRFSDQESADKGVLQAERELDQWFARIQAVIQQARDVKGPSRDSEQH